MHIIIIMDVLSTGTGSLLFSHVAQLHCMYKATNSFV